MLQKTKKNILGGIRPKVNGRKKKTEGYLKKKKNVETHKRERLFGQQKDIFCELPLDFKNFQRNKLQRMQDNNTSHRQTVKLPLI